MSAIDTFLPSPRLREVEHVAVAATRFDAWEAVRSVDLYDQRIARLLIGLRTMPERIAARWRGEPFAPRRHATIEEIVAPGNGFSLLANDHGRELVVGAIGRFWRPAIEWRVVDPAEFARFDEPGWGKLAWNLRVDDRHRGGSWLTCDLRVTATDDESWQRFRPYWRLIGRFSRALRRGMLRRMARRLGGVGRATLPGDERFEHAQFERTHHQLIEAPPSAVWPWLVQLAGRRAGWSGFELLDLAPPRALVIGSPSLGHAAVSSQVSEPPYRMTWAFVVDPVGRAASELTVRVRASYQPDLKARAASLLFGLEHEIIERVQLRKIARRAVDSTPTPPVLQ